MPPVGLIADGIDSGDRREGSKFPGLTPTSTFPQGGIAGDFNNYQQNISSQDTSGNGILLFGFEFNSCTSGHPNPGGNFFVGPVDTDVIPLSPDTPTGVGGEPRYYNPSGTNVSTSLANAHEVDVLGSCVVAPTSGTLPPSPTTGLIGVVQGTSLVINFVRLLPKGNYLVKPILGGWTNTISGFTANIYWSTPQGDNLITNVDDTGTASMTNPFAFSITQPWAWIKIKLNDIIWSGTSTYLFSIGFDPVIYIQPFSHKVAHPASTTFAVSTQGVTTVTYQWQISTNSGSTWTNLTNVGVYSGTTTATLSISNTTGLTGNWYRVNATNSNGTVPSLPGILTVT